MNNFLKHIIEIFKKETPKNYKGLSENEIEEAIPYAIVHNNIKEKKQLDVHTVYPDNWKPNHVWTLKDRIESTGRKFDFELNN